MNIHFNNFIEDKIIFVASIVGFVLIAGTLSITFFLYSYLPPFLPLFNQLAWGEARLATKQEIFLPIGIGILIYCIDISLASLLFKKTPLLSRMFGITALLICIFLFLFVVRTIRVTI